MTPKRERASAVDDIKRLLGSAGALSEVEVFCAEKVSGFFATLRMTPKRERASAVDDIKRLLGSA